MDYPQLWAAVAAEFAVHVLPDGSQDIGTYPVDDVTEADTAALWHELTLGTLE